MGCGDRPVSEEYQKQWDLILQQMQDKADLAKQAAEKHRANIFRRSKRDLRDIARAWGVSVDEVKRRIEKALAQCED